MLHEDVKLDSMQSREKGTKKTNRTLRAPLSISISIHTCNYIHAFPQNKGRKMMRQKIGNGTGKNAELRFLRISSGVGISST